MKFTDRPLIDTTIDMRYFVEEQLGEHPAGMLYQARHLVIRQPMAMLVLHRNLSQRKKLIKEFKAEIAEASRVISPHAMLINDVGRTPDQRLYVVRPTIPGETLSQCLRTRKFGEDKAIAILRQLEDALTELHRFELVHRGIRPEAILIAERRGKDFIKLLDVGCGVLLDACKQLSPYFAPEHRRGAHLTARSDIYSIGVLAYEMVTGVCPVSAVGQGKIVPIRDREPWISERYEHAVARAMSAEPNERPKTMFELIELLEPDEPPAVSAPEARRQVVLVPSDDSVGKNLAGMPADDLVALLQESDNLPSPQTRPHRPDPTEMTTLRSSRPAQTVPVPAAVPHDEVLRTLRPAPVGTIISGGASEDRPVRAQSKVVIEGVEATAVPVAEKGPVERKKKPERDSRPTTRIDEFTPKVPKSPRAWYVLAALVIAVLGYWAVLHTTRSRTGVVTTAVVDVDASVVQPIDLAAAANAKDTAVVVDAAVLAVVKKPVRRKRRPRRRTRRRRRVEVAARVPTPPTPTPPTPPTAPEAVEQEVKDILDAARKAYLAQLYDQTLSLTAKLLALRPGHRAGLQLRGVSACATRDATLAKATYRQLGARRQQLLRTVCSRHGINFDTDTENLTKPEPAKATQAPPAEEATPSSGNGS